jgi:hypothetical protein
MRQPSFRLGLQSASAPRERIPPQATTNPVSAFSPAAGFW